jgi:hypothetical protein
MKQQPKIGVIHTSPATLDLFGRLLRERIPGATIVNLLDDSILPELAANGGDLSAVEPRWRGYARGMSDRGVDLMLNACSSIGEICTRVQPDVPQTIVRVDSRMAREVVSRATRIGVVATLRTTLKPTSEIIAQTAEKMGRTVTLDRRLVEGAYSALLAGDQVRHDDLVADAIAASAQANDVVVLAQASMARVLARLPAEQQARVLTSPPFAVEDVAEQLKSQSVAS